MPQTDIKRAQARARKYGVRVLPSTRKHKKLDVFKCIRSKVCTKIASIGDRRYSDFLQHGDAKRRRLYKIRHERYRHKKGTAGYYADKILW